MSKLKKSEAKELRALIEEVINIEVYFASTLGLTPMRTAQTEYALRTEALKSWIDTHTK